MVLEQSEMMATVLAHEIKNPAALAMAYVGLLRHTAEPAEIDDYCNRIQQCLMDISELVQDLLFAAKNKPEPCNINVTGMLEEMLEEYRAAYGCSFTLNAAANLTCHVYEQHLRLVFSNLLKNAVEAAGAAGRIAVCAAKQDGYLCVEICNSPAAAVVKPYSNGMGLGICEWLLGQVGGGLEVQNGADECVVIVSIPVGG